MSKTVSKSGNGHQFDEYQDTFGLHSKLDNTLSHNKTLIWLYVIFFIITLILSFYFMYNPIARIEQKVDSIAAEAKTAFQQGEKVFDFVTEIEKDTKEVTKDTNLLLDSLCHEVNLVVSGGGFLGALGKDLKKVLEPVCKDRPKTIFTPVTIITPSLSP